MYAILSFSQTKTFLRLPATNPSCLLDSLIHSNVFNSVSTDLPLLITYQLLCSSDRTSCVSSTIATPMFNIYAWELSSTGNMWEIFVNRMIFRDCSWPRGFIQKSCSVSDCLWYGLFLLINSFQISSPEGYTSHVRMGVSCEVSYTHQPLTPTCLCACTQHQFWFPFQTPNHPIFLKTPTWL